MIWFVSADPARAVAWRDALDAPDPRHCESWHAFEIALQGRAGPASEDVVLVDLALPDRPDATRIARLGRRDGAPRLIALYPVFNIVDALALFAAGVRGYCNRLARPERLRQVVAVVQAGEVWVGEALMSQLVMLQKAPIETASESPAARKLSDREREVLYWVLRGAGNKAIARGLGISERTVKAHVAAVLRAFGARDRLQLVLMLGRTAVPD